MTILYHFLHIPYMTGVTGYKMPTQQATDKIVEAALQAPINNLIVFGILIALIIVVGVGVLIWKFAPIILNQIQQLIENNTKLTKIAEQNSSQAVANSEAINKNTMAINTLVGKTDEQTHMFSGVRSDVSDMTIGLKDFTNFQKTNNEQIVGLTEAVESRFDALQGSMDKFSKDLMTAIENNTVCAGHEETMGKILLEIVGLRTYLNGSMKRATGTLPAVVEPSKDGAS